MTIADIKNQLFSFFIKNDIFIIDSDLKKIKVTKTPDVLKKSIIIAALDSLEEEGVVSQLKDENKIIGYMSNVPLSQLSQQIEIGSQTSELIGEIVNQFYASEGVKDIAVDKMHITEYDIQQLAIITAKLLNNLDAEDTENEDEDDENPELG